LDPARLFLGVFAELHKTTICFQVHYHLTRITGTYMITCVFMIISCWILLSMRNVWDKSTHKHYFQLLPSVFMIQHVSATYCTHHQGATIL